MSESERLPEHQARETLSPTQGLQILFPQEKKQTLDPAVTRIVMDDKKEKEFEVKTVVSECVGESVSDGNKIC